MTANFGSDVFNTNIAIGRYSENDHDGEIPDGKTAKDITADYYGVQFDYTPNKGPSTYALLTFTPSALLSVSGYIVYSILALAVQSLSPI